MNGAEKMRQGVIAHGVVASVTKVPSRNVTVARVEFPIEAHIELTTECDERRVSFVCPPAVLDDKPYGIYTTGEDAPRSREVPASASVKQEKGELCTLAVRLCRDERFHAWAKVNSEEAAKQFILRVCGIGSRRDLDTDKVAASLFHSSIRRPYNDYWRSND